LPSRSLLHCREGKIEAKGRKTRKAYGEPKILKTGGRGLAGQVTSGETTIMWGEKKSKEILRGDTYLQKRVDIFSRSKGGGGILEKRGL